MSLPNLALAQSCTWHGGAVRHYARPPAASNACPSTDALTLNTMVAHSFSRRLSICARARSRSTNGCRVRHVRVPLVVVRARGCAHHERGSHDIIRITLSHALRLDLQRARAICCTDTVIECVAFARSSCVCVLVRGLRTVRHTQHRIFSFA